MYNVSESVECMHCITYENMYITPFAIYFYIFIFISEKVIFKNDYDCKYSCYKEGCS